MTTREQRRFRRFAVDLPCRVKPRKSRKAAAAESELRVNTQDISKGGLFFVAPADWQVGTDIECIIQLPVEAFGSPGVTIKCRGRIARTISLEGGGIGVGATIERFQFVRPKKKQLEGVALP
ncbi:MAG: PilZ domain-containing protein [Acidobacteria bacterium]|nr:PilZ domain-containing protein [Acidobacteriota bacterium]